MLERDAARAPDALSKHSAAPPRKTRYTAQARAAARRRRHDHPWAAPHRRRNRRRHRRRDPAHRLRHGRRRRPDAPRHDHRGRFPPRDGASLQLGPVGRGRRPGRRQLHHAGQAEGGRGAGHRGAERLARARHHPGTDARGPVVPRPRGGQRQRHRRLGPLPVHRHLPRRHPQPSRLGRLPRHVRGEGLQRRDGRAGHGGERLSPGQHPRAPRRHLHPRDPVRRHAAPRPRRRAGMAGAGHGYPRRGPRGARAHSGRARRRGRRHSAPHRPLARGAPRSARGIRPKGSPATIPTSRTF